mgnify:CR=1 FL=1
MKDYWYWNATETKGQGEVCVCGVTLEQGKLMMKENRQRELEALQREVFTLFYTFRTT